MADVCVGIYGWERRGGLALWIAAFLYLFVATSVVVNHYLVGGILLLVKRLRLSEDVAGATLLAAGSSFPVVCCSVISLARDTSQLSVGVGNIVGAGVFNIAVVVGASSLALGRTTQLDWRAVLRDAFFYLVAISALWGVLADGTVTWGESLALFLVYCAYVAFMAASRPVMAWLAGLWQQARWGSNLSAQMILDACQQENRSHETFEHTDPQGAPAGKGKGDLEAGRVQGTPLGENADRNVVVVEALPPPRPSPRRLSKERPSLHDRPSLHERIQAGSAEAAVRACLEEEGDDSPLYEYPYGTVQFTPPRAWLGRAIWLLSLPWYALTAATIPDARRRRGRRWYPLTILCASLWIAGITYALLELSERIVCITGIPTSVWSATALAAATSLPDLHASLPVARKGLGDMAVSNGVASNTFNLTFALGLPFFIVLLAAHTSVPVDTSTLTPNMVLLYLTVAAYLVPVACMRWRTSPLLGAFLLFLYLWYWVYAMVLVWDLGVWGRVAA